MPAQVTIAGTISPHDSLHRDAVTSFSSVCLRRGPQAFCPPSLPQCVSPYVPSGPGVDLLAPATTAAQPLTHLRDHEGFRQGVHVHVSLMTARFTLCPYHPHAVLTHVRKRHRLEGLAHVLLPFTLSRVAAPLAIHEVV
jgi:hypothetical protein